MRYLIPAMAILFTSCCAPAIQQTILRNQPPWKQLNLAVEVFQRSYSGWGAPLAGNQVLTTYHLGDGQVNALWKWRNQKGQMQLVWSDEDRDLAIYQVTSADELLVGYIEYSDEKPIVGEEVYWNIHTWSNGRGLGRGWVVSVTDKLILISGFHHPGTSGSPVLRADGTMIGIALGGSNWACGAPWDAFMALSEEDRLECLYRRDSFPPEMLVGPTIGGLD